MSNLVVVNQLLSQVPGEGIYSKIVHAMRDTELEEAIAQETRPEGLKILHAEAALRGISDTESELSPEQEAAVQNAITKLQTEIGKSKRNSYVQVIGNFLLEHLRACPESAEKILNPEKTITKSLDAMRTEARKNQVGGCAVLTDAEGFAVVLKYYEIEGDGQLASPPPVVPAARHCPPAANISFDVKLEDLL